MVERNSIQQWLVDAGFDFSAGQIIYHPTESDAEEFAPGWNDLVGAPRRLTQGDPVLRRQFDGGLGAPKCPRFIAEDARAIYVPAQYDGCTWLQVIYKDLGVYLRGEEQTPYPGG